VAIVKLADRTDVESRIGRIIPEPDRDWVNGLLEEASVKVRSYLRCDRDPDPVPDAIVIVVSRMVARTYARSQEESTSPEVGQTSVSSTFGPFGFTHQFDSAATEGGVWLTRQDREMLLPVSCRGRVENVSTW